MVVAANGTAVLGVLLAITAQVAGEASEIDSVEALLTMRSGLESTLVRIKRSLTRTFSEADQVFLDVTDRSAHETAESPAATGERGGA